MHADECTIRQAGHRTAVICYRGKMPHLRGVQGNVLSMKKEPGGSFDAGVCVLQLRLLSASALRKQQCPSSRRVQRAWFEAAFFGIRFFPP